jgi:hypothetical protein
MELFMGVYAAVMLALFMFKSARRQWIQAAYIGAFIGGQ